jgi:hypothetical protein
MKITDRPNYTEFLMLEHAFETAQRIDDNHIDMDEKLLDRYEQLQDECMLIEAECF